jgi:hypothetical protein
MEVLKRTSVCITHAALNTVLESLVQGVPQVGIPITVDQPGVATRNALSVSSALYHLFPKHDHAYEMFRGRPNHIKPALETSDTVH